MSLSRFFRIGLVAFLLLILSLGTAVLVVRSRAFRRYLLATVIERAQLATGGRVELGDFSVRLSGLRVDLYRVAVHGTEPDAQAPLFWADHLGVGLSVISLWERQINLREIVVDHPVVHFSIDEHGHTNLPQTPPAPPGTKPVNVFDLAIGHFVLNGGEIDYNDRQTPLDADVRDLQTQVSFAVSKREYDGILAYRQGRVQFGDYNPLQHDLRAEFGAAPSGLRLNLLHLGSGSSRITAQAYLQNYSNPTVDGSYDAVLSTRDFRDLLKNNALPLGEVSTKGTVRYRNNPGQPLLDSLSIQGQLSSPALAIDLPQARTSVRALTGEYRLDGGRLEARDVQADVLGGHLEADLAMQHLATKPEARVGGTIRGLSLADATAALRTKPQGNLQITGHLDGRVEAAWRGSMNELQVRSDATIAASTSAGVTGAGAIPLSGAVHLAYNGNTDTISLSQTRLHTSHAALDLDGSLGTNSSLRIQAQSDDLHEIDVLLLTLRQAMAGRAQTTTAPPELLGLGGSASFNGQMLGPVKNFRMRGQMSCTNLRYQSTSLPSLNTNVVLSSSGIALHQGELQTSAQGRVQFEAAVGLREWSYTPRSPIRFRVTVNKVPVADLERMANLHYPISGMLSAHISAEGSQVNPVGQGSVQLSQARAWDETIQELTVRFQSVGNTLRSTADLRSPAGSGSVRLTYSLRDEEYDAQFDVPGMRLEQLEGLRARNLQVAGLVTASGRGHGTLKAPQLEATVQAPRLQVREQKLDGLKIQASLAGRQATFSVDSKAVGTYVQARGAVTLNQDYDATVNIDTRQVELGPLLATYLPDHGGNLRGQTEVHGWLKGPLKRPEWVEAQVDLPRFSLGYQSIQIANASPIRITYRGGTLALERSGFKGTGTDLQIQAIVLLRGDGALRAEAAGNIDLHILQLLNPEWDSSGQLKLDVGAKGTLAHPEMHGMVQVVDAAVQAPGAPLGADKVNGQFELGRDRVDIRSFRAETGGGTVTAQGFAIYQPAVQFNMGLSAKQVRLRYPEGVRAVLNSDLTLNGTPESALLSGQVLIDRLSLTKSFDLATFADQFTGPSSPPSEGLAQNIKLDVGISSAQEMALSSSELNLQGSADLRVRGTAAEPVILGRTNITGGELFFNDRRYQVQTGVIQFVNPVRTEPVVNLLVTTTADQFNISLSLVGPPDRLRTTYTSDPPLPPVDIINLLVTGHTTEAAAKTPTTPQSVVAGQLAGQVSSRLGKLAGVSSLKIDPQIGGNQTGARLAIQQRVTKNLFFTFATDVTSTGNQVVQVEYQVSRKYSLSTVRGTNGSYSVQVKMHKKF